MTDSPRMPDSTVQPDQVALIARGATGKRILFTLLFILIVRVVESVLAIVILFELAYCLITKRVPSDRVVRLADRLVRYGYQIGQYLTYNKVQPPFPFDDFPNGDERREASVSSPSVA